MNTKEILERAKALIADRAHWTTHANARDGSDRPVGIKNEGAVRWCAIGAISRVSENFEDFDITATFFHEEALLAGYQSAIKANDVGGHEVVMKIFDKAIEASVEVWVGRPHSLSC